MKYEESVRRVCGDNWRTVNREERDGGYGVACIMAFLRGVRPSVADLSTHLGVQQDEIVTAHARLLRNGVFSGRFNAKRDEAFQCSISSDVGGRAWSQIAAIAGGFLGV